jgi:hypothetical protein
VALAANIIVPILLFLLCSASIWMNWRDSRRAKSIQARHAQALPLIRQAAVLHEYADVADLLCSKLEELRHHWTSAGQELARPLARTFTDQLNGWPRNDTFTLCEPLVSFRGLYEYHVGAVKRNFPNFSSNTISNAYPCYDPLITVLRNLQIHAAQLRDDGRKLMESSAVGLTR